MQLYLVTTMGAFERDWMDVLITTNLRGRAVLVYAGQPRRSDEEDGERDSRSVASSADQPADGTRYEVVEGRAAPGPWMATRRPRQDARQNSRRVEMGERAGRELQKYLHAQTCARVSHLITSSS